MPLSKKLLTGIFNQQIEASVQKHLGKKWNIDSIVENKKNAMHCAAIFKSDRYNVFVKEGDNSFSYDQFVQEAWGLRHIRENSSLRTPDIIEVLNIDGTALLVMEAIDLKPIETKHDWEVLGRGLAMLHKTTRDMCGLETHSYLGIFKQINTQMDNWIDFYSNRRLRDSFALAVEANKLNGKEFMLVETSLDKLITKLPDICGPEQPFSLLHGDPWLENLLYDGKELILVDCSIYYGNREIDLSTVDFFCPVSNHLFDAYHECYPISQGYKERINLWRVNQWLGHITLNAKYLPKLINAMNTYIG